MNASTLRVAVERNVTTDHPGSLADRLSLLWQDGEDADNIISFAAPSSPSIRVEVPRSAAPSAAEMQALIRDFRRRQRQAGMLVAVCLATACFLTAAGLILILNFAKPSHPGKAGAPVLHATTLAWRPESDEVAAEPLKIVTNQALKSEPLVALSSRGDSRPRLVNASSREDDAPASTPILATPDRALALAPLLPQRQARYLLLRGLPEAAKLSTGERNASGAWIVKNEDVANLTLTPGSDMAGDYPLEVYLLGDSNTPQARQNLLLRVGTDQAAAAPDTIWPAALLDMAMMSLAPEDYAGLAQAAALRSRGDQLLSEGDIAGARLIFSYLADQGDADAALTLARTFDAQGLAALGALDVDSDKGRATAWYTRAADTGNDEAKRRLKILASLSD